MIKYPIAEIFTSPQGEGVYTGALMTFVRLAGCTVGKPFPKETYPPKNSEHPLKGTKLVEYNGQQAILPIYTEMCTTYDGRKFECDTDYRIKERLTAQEIGERIPMGIRHVCITGGEPLMHDIGKLLALLYMQNYRVHIETSGTRMLQDLILLDTDAWVTVSPKLGVLDAVVKRANEIKLLVDEEFNVSRVPQSILEHPIVFIQPVNYEHDINEKNLQLCLKLQMQYPSWRISTQMHKFWHVR